MAGKPFLVPRRFGIGRFPTENPWQMATDFEAAEGAEAFRRGTSSADRVLYAGVRALARRRRRSLGRELRSLRQGAGMTGLDLAAACCIHHTRLSRIEQGRIVARADELAGILRALDVDTETRLLLKELHSSLDLDDGIEVVAPFERLDVVQRDVWSEVASARRFRAAMPVGVHGLLQTPEYMRGAFNEYSRVFQAGRSVAEINSAVQVRLEGQRMLFEEDRSFELVLCESAFDSGPVGPQAMMHQCLAVVQLSRLANVEIAVVPSGVLMPLLLANFMVLDDDVVIRDLERKHIYERSTRSVREAVQMYDRLRELSLHGETARERLAEKAAWWSERATIDITGEPRLIDQEPSADDERWVEPTEQTGSI